MTGAAGEEDTPSRYVDEEEDVEAAQQHGVDGEEVAGQDRARVSSEEVTPADPAPSWSRRKPAAMEHAPHRGGGLEFPRFRGYIPSRRSMLLTGSCTCPQRTPPPHPT